MCLTCLSCTMKVTRQKADSYLHTDKYIRACAQGEEISSGRVYLCHCRADFYPFLPWATKQEIQQFTVTTGVNTSEHCHVSVSGEEWDEWMRYEAGLDQAIASPENGGLHQGSMPSAEGVGLGKVRKRILKLLRRRKKSLEKAEPSVPHKRKGRGISLTGRRNAIIALLRRRLAQLRRAERAKRA